MKHLKLFFALFAMLALGVGNAWGAEKTYTFTSKSWGDSESAWTSNKDGGQLTSGRGVQVSTTYTGASATSKSEFNNVSRVVVVYSTNASKGAGTINMQIGSNAQKSFTVTSSGGTTDRNAEFSFSPAESGKVKLIINCTTNSIYVKSITIETSESGGEDPGTGGETPEPDPDPTPDPETPGSQSTATLIVGENGGVTWTNGAKTANATVGDVVFTALGSGSNDSKYYSSDKSWRFYTANTSGVKITTPEGSKIVSVIIKWKTGQPNTPTNWSKSGTSSPTTFTPNSGINTNEVSFTRNSSANFLAQEITVNYETSSSGSGSEETAASLTANPTSLDFGNVTQNNEVEAKTFTISGSDFTTGELTITAPSGYTVNPKTVSVDGTLGETTITVTPNTSTVGPFNGNVTISGANLKSSVNIALSMTVLKAPATPTSTVYVKVTSTAGITDGEYLIVYEDAEGNPKAPVAFDGSLAPVKLDVASNNIEVSIASNTIAGNTDIDDATFTINTTAGTIQTKDGYYIGQTSNANGLATSTTTKYTNTISIENDGSATIISSGGAYLRYNSANDNLRFRYYKSSSYASQKAIALYKKASSHTLTYGTCTNGSVSADVADGATVLSGTTITLSNTPAANYKLSAYDVYKTDDATVKVTVTDGKFVMPEYDVTISATFEAAKTLTSIEITTAATQTTFWQGETFNSTGLVVTAHFDGAADEVVTPTVTGSTATAGTQTVTVSYTEGTTTKTATYTITVKAIPNTKETAYSVADAYDIIDKLTTAEGVFISGIISQVDSYNSTYKSITYWISADGTTTNQLQAYSGKGLESADFTAVTDVAKGAQVIVCGNLKKHNTTYEFDYNNYLAAYTAPTKAEPGITYETTEYTANVNEAFTAPNLTNPNGLAVTYSSSDLTLATVDATTGAVTILNKTGKVTITATFAGNETYLHGTASYNITISDPSLLEATFDATVDLGNTERGEGEITKSPITFACTDGILGNNSEYRLYQNATISFTAENGYAITKVVITSTASGTSQYGPGHLSTENGTYSVSDKTGTWVGEAQTVTFTATAQSRAKLITVYYKTDNRQDAGLVWSTENVSITLGDAFTAPTLSNPNGLTLTCTSDNENLATVTNAGVVTLKSGVTGKATITAKFDGNSNYKDATVICTITVNPKIETVVILAQYKGQWYALKNTEETTGKTIAAVAVDYISGKLFNVDEAVKATIEWQRSAITDGIVFKNGDNYISGTAGSTDLKLSTTECAWTLDGTTYKLGNRTFIYRAQANGFKNYNTSNAETDDYSTLPVVTAPVYASGTITTKENLTPQMYGTICLEYNVVGFEGITFFEVAGKEDNKVIFDEVTELEAGMPYIYIAESETATIVKGSETALSARKHKSLQGTFTQIDPAESNALTGNYILYNNIIKKCGKNCGLYANRAYFIADELESLGAAPTAMPGRRRVTMGTQGENAATGLGDIQAPSVQTIKVIENGQLIIIRDGEKFNVQGQKL